MANPNTAPRGYGYPIVEDILTMNDPFYPRFWPERFWQITSTDRKPKGIFVCDMGELFGNWIPERWQEMIFTHIKICPHHRFYLLTKQPQNLSRFSPFPDNCWVGVTATTDKQYIAGLEGLREVKAKIKFISFEPLLEEVINNTRDHGFCNLLSFCHVDWVIIGSQTKPYKPPKIEWVQEIVAAADRAGVPVFLKNNLNYQGFSIDSPLLDTNYYLRQEMPW